ncbi:MAG: hypothetical protein H0W86_00400 [Armatimonadetes bacterium]|nr:hypothetical protein [Armatimonadota bacterium]
MSTRRALFLRLGPIAAAALMSVGAASIEYRIVQLRLPSSYYSLAITGNEQGDYAAGMQRTVWEDRFVFQTLGGPPRLSLPEARISALGDGGKLVGNSAKGGWEYTRDFGLKMLPYRGNRPSAYARGVNGAGIVVGSMGSRPCLWVEGSIIPLGPRPQGPSWGADINEDNIVVGSDGDGHFERAWYWDGEYHELGGYWGTALNNTGQILLNEKVGYDTFGYLYESGKYTRLYSPFRELIFTLATDLNDSGWVVGCAYNPWVSDEYRALVWPATPKGLETTGIDLNDLIPADADWHLDRASTITRSGTIYGTGTYRGRLAAFKLILVE